MDKLIARMGKTRSIFVVWMHRHDSMTYETLDSELEHEIKEGKWSTEWWFHIRKHLTRP